MNKELHLIQTGIANVASISAAFERIGCKVVLTSDSEVIAKSERVILPGVGAFGAGMKTLEEFNLKAPLKQRIAENKPTLAVCLGMQLLTESSDETPGVSGLGIIHGHVERFAHTLRVPHFGWNQVVASSASRFISTGFAYFANSYRLSTVSLPWLSATCTYGSTFVAAVEHGNILGCQFHPELSGDWGTELLVRWLEQC